ncbi:conserved hypothetical protein [Bacillus sp. 349Y]|nr:conserved hypothetical protein [Bacillus sp. 349Y]
MTYSLEMKTMIEGFGVTRFSEFKGNKEHLNDYVHKWIHKVSMEIGYRDMEILSIIVNGKEDITKDFK